MHNLKNIWGQVWLGKPDGSKIVLDTDEMYIGKGLFEEIEIQYEKLAPRGASRESSVRKWATEIDKWNKMNTGLAKSGSTIMTMTVMQKYCIIALRVDRNNIFRIFLSSH
jgi:hypothetical protein